jgi:hypothetical protein
MAQLSICKNTEEGRHQMQELLNKVPIQPGAVSIPVKTRARTHERQPESFFPKKKKTSRRKAPYQKVATKSLLEEGLEFDIEHESWGYICHGDPERYRSALVYRTPAEREAFHKKWDEANFLWECATCHSFDINSYTRGYAECQRCNEWSHQVRDSPIYLPFCHYAI